MLEPDKTLKEQNIEAYARGAQSYDDKSKMAQWNAPRKLTLAFQALNLIRPNMNVVDIGTGTGLLIESLRELKPVGPTLKIIGMDLSPEMLSQCRAKNIADQLIHHDTTNAWPLEDDTQDLIVSTGLTEYLDTEELSFAIKEASRLLKHGGSLGFTYYSQRNETITQKRHSTQDLKRAFKDSGLNIKRNNEFTAYVQMSGNRMKQTLMIGIKL